MAQDSGADCQYRNGGLGSLAAPIYNGSSDPDCNDSTIIGDAANTSAPYGSVAQSMLPASGELHMADQNAHSVIDMRESESVCITDRSLQEAAASSGVKDNAHIANVCVFCGKIGARPELLECLHTLCEDCCSNFITANQNDISPSMAGIICCICKTRSLKTADNYFLDDQHPTRKTGISMRNDFVGIGADFHFEINALNAAGDKDGNDQVSAKVCRCVDAGIATGYCINCEDYVCEYCVQAHYRLKITQGHVIKPVTEAESLKIAKNTKHEFPICPTHPQERLTLFCESCNVLTCRDCQLVEHRDHKYKFVNEKAKESRTTINILLADITISQSLVLTGSRKLQKKWKGYETKIQGVRKEIYDVADSVKAAADRRAEELCAILNMECAKKKEEFDKNRECVETFNLSAQHCFKFINAAMINASDASIIKMKGIMVDFLEKLQSKASELQMKDISDHVVMNVDEQLNKVIQMISTIGRIVVDVINSDGCHTEGSNEEVRDTQGNCNGQQRQGQERQEIQSVAVSQQIQQHQLQLQQQQQQRQQQIQLQHQNRHQMQQQQLTQNFDQYCQQHFQQHQQQRLKQQQQQQQLQQQPQQQRNQHCADMMKSLREQSYHHRFPSAYGVRMHYSQPQQQCPAAKYVNMPPISCPTTGANIIDDKTIIALLNTPSTDRRSNVPQLQQQNFYPVRSQYGNDNMPNRFQIPANEMNQIPPTNSIQIRPFAKEINDQSKLRCVQWSNHRPVGYQQLRLPNGHAQPMQMPHYQQSQHSWHTPQCNNTRIGANTILHTNNNLPLVPIQMPSSAHNTSASLPMNMGLSSEISVIKTITPILHGIITQNNSQPRAQQELQENPPVETKAIPLSRQLPTDSVIPQPPSDFGLPNVIQIKNERVDNAAFESVDETTAHTPQRAVPPTTLASLLSSVHQIATPQCAAPPTNSSLLSPVHQTATPQCAVPPTSLASLLSPICGTKTTQCSIPSASLVSLLSPVHQTATPQCAAIPSVTLASLLLAPPAIQADNNQSPILKSLILKKTTKLPDPAKSSLSTSSAHVPTPVEYEEGGESMEDVTNDSDTSTNVDNTKERGNGEKLREDLNEDWCAVCMDGGELVCCDRCPKVYHIYCHIPPLPAIPTADEIWQCNLCKDMSPVKEALSEESSWFNVLTSDGKQFIYRSLLEIYSKYDASLPLRTLNVDSEDENRIINLDEIRAKLSDESVGYKNVHEFIEDMRLVFSIASVTYEADNSVYKNAKMLRNSFEKFVHKYWPHMSKSTPGKTSQRLRKRQPNLEDGACPSIYLKKIRKNQKYFQTVSAECFASSSKRNSSWRSKRN